LGYFHLWTPLNSLILFVSLFHFRLQTTGSLVASHSTEVFWYDFIWLENYMWLDYGRSVVLFVLLWYPLVQGDGSSNKVVNTTNNLISLICAVRFSHISVEDMWYEQKLQRVHVPPCVYAYLHCPIKSCIILMTVNYLNVKVAFVLACT
jgi:hypothetical protein